MHLLVDGASMNVPHAREDKAMPSSVKEMLTEANAAVPRLNPAEVREMISKGNVLIVDVRDAPELAAGGRLKGAVNASRGMLEFRADPDSPFHSPAFQKDKTVLVYCGSGGRAALSGKTLKDLGYQSVYNAGGFKELAEAGLETEPA
jgi:rhodanese-related sulfurtransferase